MTVVIGECMRRAVWVGMLAAVVATPVWGQIGPEGAGQPANRFPGNPPLVDEPALYRHSLNQTTNPRSSSPSEQGPAEALYLRLGSVGLDATRVFRLRDAELDRPGFHLTLEDGVIGFTEDILGHVTGAFFEGEGEVLVVPPDRAERASLALFTGAAILEEKFTSAYFRFNDGTYEELQPFLRPADDAPAFLAKCGPAAVRLAYSDALRLLTTFATMLPESPKPSSAKSGVPDRVLHARLQGERLGGFDLIYDSQAEEQVEVLQFARAHGVNYYDVWMSFNPRIGGSQPGSFRQGYVAGRPAQGPNFVVPKYKIAATVTPPLRLDAESTLDLQVLGNGQRALLFELSRYLQVSRVEADGQPVEFIHNPALEGSQLERSGNDLVAVVFPHTLKAGERIALRFVYGGEVLQEEANGLLYVGARGTWYPNRGLKVADFDLEFHYPAGWTLLATGKRVTSEGKPEVASDDEEPQHAHWVSGRPIPVAGFNLGRYVKATALADGVPVEAYATREVEREFPKPQQNLVIAPDPSTRKSARSAVDAAPAPSPARNVQEVADKAAAAMSFFSQRFGPYPYSSLAVTQIPGATSQGWPGLVFLSSYAFLSTNERAAMNFRAADAFLASQTPAHETAHQWWGDLVSWTSYRDQWFSEGLANYSSLMLLETQDPDAFRIVMEKYRDDLLDKKDDRPTWQAGPVTLGQRLNSSRFPQGYEAISYGRGTWLFHMLRQMLRDAETSGPKASGESSRGDELFTRILRRVQKKYAGREISTRELLAEFEEQWPKPLWFEGKPSLEWFWDGWVQGTMIPRIELKSVRTPRPGGENFASGIIEQREAADDLVTPVPIYAVVPGKEPVLLGRVFADGEETSFRLRVPAGTRELLLDPGRTILRRR